MNGEVKLSIVIAADSKLQFNAEEMMSDGVCPAAVVRITKDSNQDLGLFFSNFKPVPEDIKAKLIESLSGSSLLRKSAELTVYIDEGLVENLKFEKGVVVLSLEELLYLTENTSLYDLPDAVFAMSHVESALSDGVIDTVRYFKKYNHVKDDVMVA